jgi:hypothetical protein
MLAEVLKSRLLYMAAVLPPLFVLVLFTIDTMNRQNGEFGLRTSGTETTAFSSLESMKEALAKNRKLLTDFERDQSALRAEVIERRKLYRDGRVGKDQVTEAEDNFIAALKRVYEMRRSVDEDDIAITEAVLGEKVLRMPALSENGYRETPEAGTLQRQI